MPHSLDFRQKVINKEKDLIAPIIFKVTLNAVGFEQWLDKHLLPLLEIPSVLLHR